MRERARERDVQREYIIAESERRRTYIIAEKCNICIEQETETVQITVYILNILYLYIIYGLRPFSPTDSS